VRRLDGEFGVRFTPAAGQDFERGNGHEKHKKSGPRVGLSGGVTLTIQGDGSILASGTSPATDVYTVTAFTSLTGITGIRLEVLENASLPGSGPGRQPLNGNFVLSEFQVDAAAVPEPASLAIWSLSAFGCAIAGYRRRKLA